MAQNARGWDLFYSLRLSDKVESIKLKERKKERKRGSRGEENAPEGNRKESSERIGKGMVGRAYKRGSAGRREIGAQSTKE